MFLSNQHKMISNHCECRALSHLRRTRRSRSDSPFRRQLSSTYCIVAYELPRQSAYSIRTNPCILAPLAVLYSNSRDHRPGGLLCSFLLGAVEYRMP